MVDQRLTTKGALCDSLLRRCLGESSLVPRQARELMSSVTQSPTSALVAHAERVASGSRILVIGNADNVLPQHLLQRGARLVQVLDPDARRVAHAAAHNSERRISYAKLTDSSLRDASFDCAIVEDLAQSTDPGHLLSGVRRSIGQRGLAFICCASNETTSGLLGVSPSQLSYGEIDELTAEVFDDTMLLGQAPFVGYAVVSLSLEDPPEPCLDNEFLGGEAEAADLLIFVCGSEEALAEVDFEDMTIVQLPAARVLEDGKSQHKQQQLRAQRRIESLESELQALRERSSPEEVQRLTRELEERDSWIRELETRAVTAEARADDAEAGSERLERQVQELKELTETAKEAEVLSERLDEAERVAARSQKETRWAEDRVRKLERELEAALAEIDAGAAADLEKATADLTKLEKEVQRLEKEKAELRAELERTQQKVRGLECQLEETEEELDETHQDLLRVTDLLTKNKKALKEARATRQVEPRATEPEQAKPEQAVPQSSELREAGAQKDYLALEHQLAERGKKVAQLEEQLRSLEILSKSLTAELTLAKSTKGNEDLEARLDSLSHSLAEREADLVAAEWTIGELRQRLAARPS